MAIRYCAAGRYEAALALTDAMPEYLEDQIIEERARELAFEGEYWFDLVRTGRAATVLAPNFDAWEGLWPIPVGERDVAPNMTQNPGYGG